MNSRKLKGKLAEAGCSQKILANRLGMAYSTLNAKVNGRVPFHTNEVLEICRVLAIENDAEKAAIFLGKPSQKWD